MKPKIADEVPAEDWELLARVREIVEALPPLLKGPAYFMGVFAPKDIATSDFKADCHMMTRALAKFLPVEVHDGFVVEYSVDGKRKNHTHSWLTRQGSDGKVIIDPWPLGVVSGPALFIQDYAFHFGRECVPLHTRQEDFKRYLAILRFEIRKIIRSNQELKAAA